MPSKPNPKRKPQISYNLPKEARDRIRVRIDRIDSVEKVKSFMLKNEGLMKKKINSIDRKLASLDKGFHARRTDIELRARLVEKRDLLVDKYGLLDRMANLSLLANQRLYELEGKRKDQLFDDMNWWSKQTSFSSQQLRIYNETEKIQKQIKEISAKLN